MAARMAYASTVAAQSKPFLLDVAEAIA